MSSAICTLFEGHYHFGVAVLTNSLYRQGFRGNVYAGYRGSLPAWAQAPENPALNWPGGKTLSIADGLHLHFLPLDTEYHLTNYKPDFMIRVWQNLSFEATSLFYFDPDIVINAPWSAFAEWVTCGVALCEDVNSPLSEYHPIRMAWRRYFGAAKFVLQFKNAIYANGGFVGVAKQDISFLATWQAIQEAMAPAIGGLQTSTFTVQDLTPFAPFSKTDQDALNVAVEAWEGNVSFLGQEGMAFKVGATVMSHALGKNKPWLWSLFQHVSAAQSVRIVDRDYWNMADGPIAAHPLGLIRRRRWELQIAALIGRFYKRG